MVAVRRVAFESPGPGSCSGAAARAWFLASLGFVLAAFTLGVWVEPLDHGYTRYATLAFEMVRSGDWIAPHLDDGLYVDKPPLVIWLIALPMALANSTASFTQHAPNLVAVVLSVLFLRRLGARSFGRADAGWLAGSALAILRDGRESRFFHLAPDWRRYHAAAY